MTSVKCMDLAPAFLFIPKPRSLKQHLSKCALCCLCGAMLPGKCHSWKTEHSGRMKTLFRSALVLIRAAAPEVCLEPGEELREGKGRMGTCVSASPHASQEGCCYQPWTNSGLAAREVNRTKILGKTCMYEKVILKYKSCMLSTFIKWCSVLSAGHRMKGWQAKATVLPEPWVTPSSGTGYGYGYSPPKKEEQCWWRLPS